MNAVFLKIAGNFLRLLKPVFFKTVFKDPRQIKKFQKSTINVAPAGMVGEFNVWHKWIFLPFFRRVQFIKSDVIQMKKVPTPVVYVMKNRGQLEYRYFNYLFLKEKIPLVRHANHAFTLYWWPLKKIVHFILCQLHAFYARNEPDALDDQSPIESSLAQKESVLLSLTISRDYLFGLIKTNPQDVLEPLIAIQKSTPHPIHVVPLQFLYDKHPDKTSKTYFDLLFGDKSQPGAIRKFLLFLMNYRRKPQVKFGAPLNLTEFLAEKKALNQPMQCQDLLDVIEEELAIEKIKITGPRVKSRDALIREIVASPVFLERIHSLAAEHKKQPQEYKKSVRRHLAEIAADVNYSYVHFCYVTLSYFWNNVFDGVAVKPEQLARIREVAGKNPVVLVPMHRSHIDYLLISYIFYENNITFPYVCGGINMNFWPIGSLVRKCGGFFIRRRFSGNKLYQESLYAYLKSLIASGHCLEFFIEGTRSRTGKMLRPRTGVLSLLLRAWLERACHDVYFVPIAIMYDQILEQKSYQRECSGEDKTKEDAGELIKAARIFGKKYGKVYVEFAEPVSLREYCQARHIVERDVNKLRDQITGFARHLTHQINQVAVVTPMALVSLAILSLNKKTFNFKALMVRMNTFKDYLDFKKVNYSDLINFSAQYAYNSALNRLCERNILKKAHTFEEDFFIFEPAQRVELDYYKNNILHFFVSLTCLAKILKDSPDHREISLNAVVKQEEIYKTFFRHDFTFDHKADLREHLQSVVDYCEQKGFVSYDKKSQRITKTLTEKNFYGYTAFQGLLDNFLESHLIALKYLKHNSVQNVEQRALIKDILTRARPLYLKDELRHPEALSKFNLENSLLVMEDLGILTREQKEQRIFYSATADTERVGKWLKLVTHLLTPPAAFDVSASGKKAGFSDMITQEGLH